MGKTINIGRLFGIQFRLHFSWFVIFILITGILVYPDFSHLSRWVIAIITSLLFFTSVIAHELAHSLVGRANGISISSITLFIFGGIAQMAREATRPGAEFKMAIAGPLSSLTLGLIFGAIWLLVRENGSPFSAMVSWLAIMNLMLAFFNLIPGFPLDGGRVFRSLLWHFTGNFSKATRIATRVGQGFGYMFMLGGIMVIVLRPMDFTLFEGVWIVAIGWFLESAASASYKQIGRKEAGNDFTPPEHRVPEGRILPPGPVLK